MLEGIEIWTFVQDVAEVMVTFVLVPVIGLVGNELRKWLKAKIGAENLSHAWSISAVAVREAEQRGLFEQLDGPAKKQAALNSAQAWLDKQGIKLDAAALEMLIEAQVLDEFNKTKKLAAPE